MTEAVPHYALSVVELDLSGEDLNLMLGSLFELHGRLLSLPYSIISSPKSELLFSTEKRFTDSSGIQLLNHARPSEQEYSTLLYMPDLGAMQVS